MKGQRRNGLFAWAALAVCTLGAWTAAADGLRVALVHGKSEHDMKCEFDRQFKALDWKVDKYLDANLANLTPKLDEYDIVIFGMGAYASHAGSVDDFVDAWSDWINFGGALVMTCANEPGALGKWVAKLGKDLDCATVHCTAYKKPSAETAVVKVAHDPLLEMPKPLGRLYAYRGKQWSHYTKLSSDWKTPLTCYDDAPLLAYRRVGKGLILLTVAGDFKGSLKSSTPVDPVPIALFANVAAYMTFAKAGLEVKDFVKFERSGVCATGCRLVLGAKDGSKLSATLVSENASATGEGAKSSVTAKAKKLSSGDWELAPAGVVSVVGEVKRTLEVKLGDKVVSRLEWMDEPNAPLGVSLLRRHLFPGDDLTPIVTVNPPKEAAGKVEEIEWRIDDGKWQGGVEAKDGRFAAAVGQLKPGEHVFHARFKYAQGFLARLDARAKKYLDWGLDATAAFTVHPEPKYRFRKDHVLLENGKPFFPFGFYHVTSPDDSLPRQAAAEKLAKWGYNTIFGRAIWAEGNPNDPRYANFKNFLDACERDGMRVISECQCKAEPTIKAYGNHPAVMGWLLADEPAAFGYPPEVVRDRYESYLKLDDKHIYYMVLCQAGQCRKYAPYTNVIAPDVYPPKENIKQVYEDFKSTRGGIEDGGATMWSVVRAHGGQGYRKSKEILPGEFRLSAYLAAMAGAKGILYYAYLDLRFDLEKASEEVQEAVRTFPAEFKQLVPFLLDGTREVLVEGEDGVYAAKWTLDGKTAFVAVNTGLKKTVSVKVPFEGGKRLVGDPEKIPPLDRVVIFK